MADIVKQNPQEYSWVRYIKKRIDENKNFMAIISGATGSGKSWSALSIGQLLDPEFDVSRVIFRGTDLLKLINSGKLKKGSVIVWDEAGVDLSNRSWQSATNKLLNFLLQTFRHKNIILLFTTPYSDFVDKLTRRLFHAEFKTISIDFDKNTTKIKPLLIQYNARYGKFYYKFLRIIHREGGAVPISEWNVPSPSKELIKAYEGDDGVKSIFTSQLNAEIESELMSIEGKKELKLAKKEQDKEQVKLDQECEFIRPLTRRQKEVYDLYLKHDRDASSTAKELNITRGCVYQQLRALSKKMKDQSVMP